MHTSWIKVKNPKSPAMLRAEGQCSLRFLRPARFVAMIVAALAIGAVGMNMDRARASA
jgi:hypothetical protein